MCFKLLLAGVSMVCCGFATEDLDVKSAVLIANGREQAPERIISPVPSLHHAVKGGTLQIDDTSVTLRQKDDSIRWSAKLPEQTVAALAEQTAGKNNFWKVSGEKNNLTYAIASPATLQRLSLTDGKWLAPLKPTAEGVDKVVEGEEIWAVRRDETIVYVLSGKIKSEDLHERHLDFYRVTCFGAESGHQNWSRRFSSAGDTPSVGVGHWISGGGPRYASADINELSVLNGKVLVCAGPSQPIPQRLKSATAKKPGIWNAMGI